MPLFTNFENNAGQEFGFIIYMKNKMLSRAIGFILLAALLTSGFLLEMKLNGYRLEKEHKIQTSMQIRKGREVDFSALKSKNEDAKAWIYLPDSEIDYPIVQAEDNEYYLHRGLDKQYLYEGTLFIDCYNEHPFHDKNTIIFGHHMFSGSMFCGLDNFSDEDYFKKHNIIQLTTEEGEFDLHVIAYCNEDAEDELYQVPDDDLTPAAPVYTEEDAEDEDAEPEEQYGLTSAQYVELIKEKAKILSDEPFTENDTFVTLSTCAYNYDDARTQVICTIKEPGLEEIKKETVSDNPLKNIWLLAQIGVGLIMALIVLVPVIKAVRGRR